MPTWERLKAIEQVALGDFVLSQPEFQGERRWRRVNEVFRREPQDLVAVTIAAGARRETITATTEHPFWVVHRGHTLTAMPA